MKALVAASARFSQTPDGHLWTANASLDYEFWTRYLCAYDEVRLLVQADACAEPPANWNRATGPGIVAAPIPNFLSPRLLAKNLAIVKRIVRETLDETQAVHLRVACFVGGVVWRALKPGQPFGVEVVTDPYDSLGPGAAKHLMRPALRAFLTRDLKNQCARASAAAYVTQHALQRRYPPAPDAFTTHFSSIVLQASAFVDSPRAFIAKNSFKLIFVGTLAQLYKAPDVLIEAVSLCARDGIDLQLSLIGEGKFRAQLEAQAASLGIASRIVFRGQLSDRNEVQKELDEADLFVLPSHQEGLPRAMVEAMARALPCVGSTVGGIPELLSKEDLVAPGDAKGLAKVISGVIRNPIRMEQMSKRNLERAHEYEEGILRARREEFYAYVKRKTEMWMKAGGSPGVETPG